MRNILSFHKIDYSKAIDTAIQTCLNDDKACMSMNVNQWVGWLSNVKLASDQSRFWYIVDPKNKWHNWQTTWYNATSTVYDEYWEWWEYDDSWTRIDTLRKSQWWYSTMWAAVADCWAHNFASATFVYLPKWEERSRQSFEYDIWMWNYWLASVWVGWKYFIFWHRSSENSRQSAWKTYVWNTTTWWWNVSRFGSSYCRYWTVKYYETDDVCRIYYKWTWNNVSEDYRWWYIDVNKRTWEMSSFTSMTQADVEAIQNNYPSWYYSDLTNMELLTNYEEYSWWCYFNWTKVWTGWYFQRWRDNKAMGYIFRPVNLVTSSSWWWSVVSDAAVK